MKKQVEEKLKIKLDIEFWNTKSISEIISYLEELKSKFGEIRFNLSLNGYNCRFEQSFYRIRDETDEEYLKRINQEDFMNKKKEKERERERKRKERKKLQQYLKLKAEFENENIK